MRLVRKKIDNSINMYYIVVKGGKHDYNISKD